MNIWQRFYIRKKTHFHSAKSNFVLFAFLCILLLISVIVSLKLGAVDISITEAFKAFFRGETSNVNCRILFYVRLPRVIAALLCGCALSVSGVIIQAILNNSMASSNIIGINSGAGLGIAIIVSLCPDIHFAAPIAAFIGAILACLLIYAISFVSGVSKMTLTLTGIAVSSILNAAISSVKTVFPETSFNITSFSVGGFNSIDVSALNFAAPVIIAGLFLSLIFSRDIDIMSLGINTAQSLGMNVKFKRLLFFILAALMSAAAVSFSGLISFVGLVVPHIIRRFTGSRHKLLIPCSMIGGALFVLLCDLFGRVIFAPYEIPVGILLAFIGGPFFIFLILRERRHI